MNVVEVTIVCTDKGQHPLATLGDVAMASGVSANVDLMGGRGREAERRKDECVWNDGDPTTDETMYGSRVNFRCPRCGRHVQWKHENAVDKLTRLGAAGVTRLDISTLP